MLYSVIGIITVTVSVRPLMPLVDMARCVVVKCMQCIVCDGYGALYTFVTHSFDGSIQTTGSTATAEAVRLVSRNAKLTLLLIGLCICQFPVSINNLQVTYYVVSCINLPHR